MTRALTLAILAFTAGAGTGCAGRPIFDRPGPLIERRNPAVSASGLRTLGTIAGGGSRNELRISVTIRQQLADSGLNAVATEGRWDTQQIAVTKVCDPGRAPALDGVLFIWYNRLELFDCGTQLAAYEISGGGLGINQMADRLVAYLKQSSPGE